MATFRVVKDKQNPYIMINKHFIYDNKLSLKAKGLMAYFLSRPDNWEFYIKEIKRNTIDKDTAISSAIKELVKCGYIQRESKRSDDGKFQGGYNYSVYELPIIQKSDESIVCINNSPKLENPESGKSPIGETPNWENQALLNNELKLNNKTTTTDNINKKVNKLKEKSSCSGNNFLDDLLKYLAECGFSSISKRNVEKYKKLIEIHGIDKVKRAVEIADENERHTFKYVEGILKKWSNDKEKQESNLRTEEEKFYPYKPVEFNKELWVD